MTRRGVVVFALIGALVWAGAAAAQEVPEPPRSPGAVGVVDLESSIRVGDKAVGLCGEPGYHAPYGNGLGFLEPGKALHWRIDAPLLTAVSSGGVHLCGQAAVPVAQVPEIGTAGPCDSLAGIGGRGELILRPSRFPFSHQEPAYTVHDVELSSAGSVLVVTGALAGAEGEQDGTLLVLLQRRSHGMCLHKSHPAPVGTSYPQGSTFAELTGVVAYQFPRPAFGNTACDDHWGKVRRHLGGAGAGLECPAPPAI